MLEREVKVGGIYKHFKGHIYCVIGIAKDSETLLDMVVYKNMDNGDMWIRSKSDFLSFVDKNKYPDVEQEYRFELISESER